MTETNPMSVKSKRTRASLRRIKGRSYKHLETALAESDRQLRKEWWISRDPDLETVRDVRDPRWQIMLTRYDETRTDAPVLYPADPWGSAELRASLWTVTTLLLAALLVSLLVVGASWWLIVVTLALGARSAFFLRSRRREARTEATNEVVARSLLETHTKYGESHPRRPPRS